MNIHKETRINKQDRQKITFPGSAYPKEISQQYTPATHRRSALPEGPLWVFHPYLWPPKAPGSTLGGGSPNISSAHWRQYPLHERVRQIGKQTNGHRLTAKTALTHSVAR